ncbi:MAG: iron ABC transporter permease [Candidatus Methanoplasma sp.]|nr:iron ABC transporter permease [Candidatus Methanoplasma sp.]
MTEQSIKTEYRREIIRRTVFISVFLCILFAAVVLSCSIGTDIGFSRTYEVIIDHIMGTTYPLRSTEWWEDYYIWNNVMPCIALGMIGGAGLAVGGTVMQSLMGNPLADPYTTGISSGACLGAVTAIIVGLSLSSATGEYGIMTNAFIFALIPAIIVIWLTRYVGNSPSTMILIGTAISYFFNAMVTFLMITTDTDTLQAAFIWQIGSVSGASWGDIPAVLAIVAASSFFVQIASRKLNLMMLGENNAKSLGLNVEQFRMVCLILLSVLVAVIVSHTGIIGFVGLVSPHIARFMIGSDNRFVTPAAMILGALLLVLADMVSRSLSSMGTVPIGVVMAFIGSPIFLYLVIRQKSSREIF